MMTLDFRLVADLSEHGRVWNVHDEYGRYVGEVRRSYTSSDWVFISSAGQEFTEGVMFQVWAFTRKLLLDDKADAAPPKPAELVIEDEPGTGR